MHSLSMKISQHTNLVFIPIILAKLLEVRLSSRLRTVLIYVKVMPSVFLDGVLKMVKNTGSVEIHGTQTGVTMVSSRSREATTNAVSNPKWLVVFQWTAKTFTFKISRIYPAILNRLFKI